MTAPVLIQDLGPGASGRYKTEHLAVRSIIALQAVGLIPAGLVESAEGSTQDTRAGIDYMVHGPGGAAYSIGIHVGRGREHGTFSMRYRTSLGNLSELTKRARSISGGGTYPSHTVHTYANPDTAEILQAYVASTRELWQHVVQLSPDNPERFTLCSCASRPQRNPDGSEFIAVAVTEPARARMHLRATLIGHGVAVGMLRPATVGEGLGL